MKTYFLADLHDRHYGLTPAVSASFEEAARVCLDRHHSPPALITIRGDDGSVGIDLDWRPADDRARAAWANELDATRDGAYALVIAAGEIAAGLYAVRRADHATGADYYVAPADSKPDDLESYLRLEVSGMDTGATSDLERRLRTKLKQLNQGESNLPALAGVVAFSIRLVLFKRVTESEAE